MKEAWKTIPSDVQAVYGWDYVKDIIEGCRKRGGSGCESCMPVTDAIVHALINTSPKCRYVVHGGNKWVEIWSVSTDSLSASGTSRKHAYIKLTPLNPTFI